jgi:hypothetical protein
MVILTSILSLLLLGSQEATETVELLGLRASYTVPDSWKQQGDFRAGTTSYNYWYTLAPEGMSGLLRVQPPMEHVDESKKLLETMQQSRGAFTKKKDNKIIVLLVLPEATAPSGSGRVFSRGVEVLVVDEDLSAHLSLSARFRGFDPPLSVLLQLEQVAGSVSFERVATRSSTSAGVDSSSATPARGWRSIRR